MNSIKNAIVTVTLLAVGYGSYVVLSEPLPSSPQTASTVAPEAGAADVTSRIDLASPSVDLSSPSVDVASPSVDAVPPNGNPFGSPANPSVTSDSLPDFAMSESPRSEAAGPSAVETVTIAPISPPVSSAPSAVGIEGVAEQAPTPSVQLTPSTPVQIQEPSHQGFPELPPLPEMMSSNQHSASASGTLGASDVSSPSSSLAPQASIESDPLASPTVTVDPATMKPSGSSVQDALQPPVGGVDAGFQKSPTSLAAPDQIDLQPADTRPRPTPMLPPIDPSLGPIPPPPSEGNVAFEKNWSAVQELIRANDLARALRTLTPYATDNMLNQEQRERSTRLLNELAGAVVYSRDSYMEPAYIVRAGETLDEIAATYGIPMGLLAKINGIAAPYALTTGEAIKVVRGPFRADVSISKQELTLYTGAYYAGRFRVAIGPDLPNEEAFYEVGEKSLGRNYFDRRTGKEILRGQPGNRYGDHWMGLRGEHITTGHSVGIHGRERSAGTPNPASNTQQGCISLDAIDADDLFAILSVGSRVHVRR